MVNPNLQISLLFVFCRKKMEDRAKFFFVLVLCCLELCCSCFNLTLLHTNDVHSHFIEFNAYGGRCSDKLKEEKNCYGGFARQVTKVKEIKSNHENVLFLNGGDFYQGTVWYTLHRWHIVADLVNMLGIDVMSLGNHEFDDGIKGLLPYLKNLKTKVVVCNINSSMVPEFGEFVTPSVVHEVGGEKIGVIGYLTPETKFLSSAGALEFEDEVECIKREAKRLSTEGLTKIFAVGHSGFDVDQKIAKEVPEIDIVVGGHTNTFLYTGTSPSVEVPQGPYPVVVEREDGSKALVVQDYAFGKYMGHLEVLFDEEGSVVSWEGNPILLDSAVPEDPETLELLEPYGQEVKRRVRQTVGHTNVLLRGDRMTCRMKECNLGNFLADASLNYFIEQPPTDKGWNFVAISFWNSGGIRSSIDERAGGGNITFEDVLSVAPFGNTMDVVALKGKHLKQVLENSVKDYDLDAVDPPGSFLQVSGLKLVYNVSNPINHRLVEAHARCSNCRVPKYRPLEDEEVYWVVMSTYMARGGDGFETISQNSIGNRNTDELDIDIIMKYAQKSSPVTTGLEGRITILSSRDSNMNTPAALSVSTREVTPNEEELLTDTTTESTSEPTISSEASIPDVSTLSLSSSEVTTSHTLPISLVDTTTETISNVKDVASITDVTNPTTVLDVITESKDVVNPIEEALNNVASEIESGVGKIQSGIDNFGKKLKKIRIPGIPGL